MTISHLLPIYDQDLRIAIEMPGMTKESFPNLVRFRREPPGMNYVAYSRYDAAEIDAVIDRQILYFSQFDQPYSWDVYAHDTPSDLKERLIAHGFQPDEDPGDVMLLDLSQPPAGLLAPITADIRRITGRAGLEHVIQVEEAVWGGSFAWMRNRMGSHLEIPGYLSLYVAYLENQPVSTAWVYYPPNIRFASLYGGSTLPQYRGRGLYTALLAARLQDALRRNRQFLTIDAGPMSRPIVAKHGFQYLTTIWSLTGPSQHA